MHCPFCGHSDTKVIDSRLAGEGRQIRRRRECLKCIERFTTFETAELLLPAVVKSDQSREPFDEHKLRAGMRNALQKRPVGSEAIEESVARICHRLINLGEREVSSRSIGELVMEELRHLDEVAYVRFASVYRSFQDVEAFRTEIDQMRTQPRRRRAPSEDQLPLLPGESRRELPATAGGRDMPAAAAQNERESAAPEPSPRREPVTPGESDRRRDGKKP